MARPPRPPQPSALDGFRRLERTRSVALGQHSVRAAVATLEPARDRSHRRRGASHRVAGALRLLAFAVALVVIVGTSVSLANSGRTSSTVQRAATKDQPRAVPVVVADDAAASRSGGAANTGREARRAEAAPAADAPADATTTTAATAAAPAAAASTPRGRPLPFTGPLDTLRMVLLGGSLLVVLGMLVQVAGQPLPARARARR